MAEEIAIQTLASPTALRVVINYIHEGLVDNRHNSKRQRRRLLRMVSIREQINFIQCTFSKEIVCPIDDTITFPPVDSNWVMRPHEDGLVLTLGVGGFNVRRILVDLGNSLTSCKAYKQKSYSSFALENPGCLSSRFNGATTTSLGDIVLLVQAGPVTLNVWLSVVDDLSLYNAIIGHAWLHRMKVTPSTYHQMVSYLVE